MSYRSDCLVYWVNIGGGGPKPGGIAARTVGWPDLQPGGKGWWKWVSTQIYPYLDLFDAVKCKPRVLLHNPFGSVSGATMDFGQYSSARDAGLTCLVDGFYEAWRPLKGVLDLGLYFGNVAYDGPIQQMLKASDTSDAWERINETLDVCSAAGVTWVGLDSSVADPIDSITWQIAQAFLKRGIRVYAECRPIVSQPQWNGFPLISQNNLWNGISAKPDQTNAAGFNYLPDASLAATEVVRLVGFDGDPLANIASINKAGHTAGVWLPNVAARLAGLMATL